MSLRAVTFDAAGTLIRVNWQPGSFAVDCLEELGIGVDRQVAAERYDRLVLTRRREYEAINAMRSIEACRVFWKELTADWLRAIGLGEGHLEEVWSVSDRFLYGGSGRYFALYEDVGPVLDTLRSCGLKLGVISNWDYSLHRILDSLGVAGQFDVTVASLMEGIEKPEPRIFEIGLTALGVAANETLHVGDDPIDDVSGALAAGMSALLLDRIAHEHSPSVGTITGRGERIGSLLELEEALDWIA